MYFSLAFILTTLPFLTSTAVVPLTLTDSPASGGVVVPINKIRSLIDNNGTVNTTVLQSGINRVVAKIELGFIAYQLNTGVPHPLSGSIASRRKRGLGSDPLTYNSQAQLWYGTISVGTPAVSFTVSFDTGSSDLLLPSTRCDSSCSGHKTYGPNASSSSRDLGQPFFIGFGDDSVVQGEQFTDVVQIAGLTATRQTLGAAAQYRGLEIGQFPADGLMGMGFQSISVFNAPPLFQTLISEGVVTTPLFGLKLAASGSELFLGGTNSVLYTGAFTWLPLTIEGYWQASFDSISVNGQPVLGSTVAIFDTGSVQIIGDPNSIAKLFAPISGARLAPNLAPGLYTIPCSFNTSISFGVGGKNITISPASFNLGPAPGSLDTCIAGAASDNSLNGVFWVLGDVFLQNVYTAFDAENGFIGFADLA